MQLAMQALLVAIIAHSLALVRPANGYLVGSSRGIVPYWRTTKRVFDNAQLNKREPAWMLEMLASQGKRAAGSEYMGGQLRRRRSLEEPSGAMREKLMANLILEHKVLEAERYSHLLHLLKVICGSGEVREVSGFNGVAISGDEEYDKRVFGSARLAGKRSTMKIKKPASTEVQKETESDNESALENIGERQGVTLSRKKRWLPYQRERDSALSYVLPSNDWESREFYLPQLRNKPLL